jgi:hypothetical protein
VRPLVTVAFTIGPRERDRETITGSLYGIDAQVAITLRSPPANCRGENLTGLIGAMSGGRRLPEPPAAASTAPVDLGMHQGHERLDI